MKRFFRIYLFILFLHMCMFPAFCFHQRTYMAQSLVNGVINETWTHSCFEFKFFKFSLTGYISKAKELSLSYYFSHNWGVRISSFMPFTRTLAWSEMQTALSACQSISSHDKHYAIYTYIYIYIYVVFSGMLHERWYCIINRRMILFWAWLNYIKLISVFKKDCTHGLLCDVMFICPLK